MVKMQCPKCGFIFMICGTTDSPKPEESVCPCGNGTMEVIDSPEPTPISRICRLCVNRGSLCTECPIIGLTGNPNVHFSDIVE
jgi:hypothetical protein